MKNKYDTRIADQQKENAGVLVAVIPEARTDTPAAQVSQQPPPPIPYRFSSPGRNAQPWKLNLILRNEAVIENTETQEEVVLTMGTTYERQLGGANVVYSLESIDHSDWSIVLRVETEGRTESQKLRMFD